MIRYDLLNKAKHFIKQNSYVNKNWTDPISKTTTMQLATQKAIPDLELVRILCEDKPNTPIIPREKIRVILQNIKASDLTKDNFVLLLQSYQADPRDRNSVKFWRAPVNIPKMELVKKLLDLANGHTISLTAQDLKYLKPSVSFDKSLFKEIINTFKTIKELDGLRQAMEKCDPSMDDEMDIDQRKCEVRYEGLKLARKA